MEGKENSTLCHLTVIENLNTPLIMGIDAIHHLNITYLSTSETFMFQKTL
jgi:hypothetical protein